MQDMEVYSEMSENMDKHLKNLNKLSKKLEKSKDIKESSDLNNQIQSQVALMNAQKIQFDTYKDTRKLRQEQADLQRKAAILKSQSNWNYR
jgi:transport associated protein 4